MTEQLLTIGSSTEEGYQPLIHSDGWRVAVANFRPSLLEQNLVKAERHLCTDEVFILLTGSAALFIGDDRQRYTLEPCKTYNVHKNVWHSLAMLPDSTVLIIENDSTSPENTEYRYFE